MVEEKKQIDEDKIVENSSEDENIGDSKKDNSEKSEVVEKEKSRDNVEKGNDNVIFVVQIENQIAVNNINEIFSSDNIHSYIIGPYDLTGSMGIVGAFNNPDYKNNLKIIKNSAIENGIKPGIHVVNPDIVELTTAVDEDYSFIAYSTDALLIYDKCKKDLNIIANLKTK